MNEIELLKTRISEAGGVSKLAKGIGAKQNTVSNWLNRGRVPAGWVKYFESAKTKRRVGVSA